MKSSRLIVAAIFLLVVGVPCHAQDPSADQVSGEAAGTPSMLGQATEATVGRVFGVEGDASDIKYHVIEFTSHTPASSATRSLLIPGWGQYFNQQKTKGTIFFLSTLGVIMASAHLYGKADHAYDQYVAQGDRDGSKYDDYTQYHNQAIIFGSAAAILWIASIFDAYHNAYNPLYSKAPSVDVALLEEGGAQLRVKKTF